MKRACHCGRVVDRTPCEKCRCKSRYNAPKHGERYDRKWRVLSESFRHLNPLCHDCYDKDIATPADEVHHIIPISEDPSRRLDITNLVSLCQACHRERHRQLRHG